MAIKKPFARFVSNQWNIVPQRVVQGGYRCAQGETVISWDVQSILRAVAVILGISIPIESIAAMKKYLIVMIAILVGLGYFVLVQDSLTTEEDRWCKEFRPDLSLQECGNEFGY